MAFIRKKQQKGKSYYYLVVNQRDGGKVKQKVIAYLGKHATLEAALQAMQQRMAIAKGGIRCEEEWIRRNAEQGLCTARDEHLKQFYLQKCQRLEERLAKLELYAHYQKERSAQPAGSSA